MSRYRGLLVNLLVFGVSTVATKLISFFLVPLYTSYMTTGEFGVTDMALTVITLAMPLVTLSAGDATLRYAIDDRGHADRYITLGLAANVLGIGLVALLLPVLDLSVFGGLGNYKVLFLAAYATNSLLAYHGNVARALNQLKLITWDAVLVSLTTAGSAVVFIAWLRMGVDGYFYSLVLGALTGVLLFAIAGRHLHRLTRIRRDDRTLVRAMAAYALPLIPNALFWWMGTSINRFFITGMLGIAASGLFAAASKLPNLLNLVYNVFQQAWTLSAFQEFRKSDVSGFFSTVLGLLNAFLAVGAALLAASSPWLAAVLLKGEFYSAWPLIPMLLVAIYFNSLNAFYGSVFTTTLKTRALFTTTMAGALCSVALTWLLIPPLGLMGPCLAMAASNLLVLLLRMRASRGVIPVRVRPLVLTAGALLLAAQAAVMAIQPAGWQAAAWVLTACIALIQIPVIAPDVRRVMTRMAQHKERAQASPTERNEK